MISSPARIHRLREWIENHLGTTMAIGAAFGLLVPGWSAVPSGVVVALLGLIIYLACFRIGVLSIRTFSLPRIAVFFLLRFVALPIVVFFVAQALSPKYVLPLVVLTAMPAGVAAAAFTSFLGGTVSLAFILVVLTNLSTPILVPLVMRLTAGTVIYLDTLSIFCTLALAIFVPMASYGLTRNIRSVKVQVERFGRSATVVVVALIIMLVVGARREFFLEHPGDLPELLLVSSLGFVILFLSGWYLNPAGSREDRIACTISSGCNNVALGVSIAVMYFPPEVGLFLIISEIPWMLGPVVLKRVLGRT